MEISNTMADNKHKGDDVVIMLTLEEEIQLEENSLQSLLQRSSVVEKELLVEIHKKRTLYESQLNLNQKQVQFKLAKTKNVILEKELKESLRKSRDRYLALLDPQSQPSHHQANQEIATEEPAIEGDPEPPNQRIIASTKVSAPLVNLHTMGSFHDHPRPPNALMTFLPMIDASLVLEIMIIYAREASLLGKNRRHLLSNSCLDFHVLKKPFQTFPKQSCLTIAPEERQIIVDPNISMCPYELAGICADQFCPYQHSNRPMVPRELLPLPPLPVSLSSTTTEIQETPGKEARRTPQRRGKMTSDAAILDAESSNTESINEDFISLPTAESSVDEDMEESSEDEEENIMSAYLKESKKNRSLSFWWGGEVNLNTNISDLRPVTELFSELGVSLEANHLVLDVEPTQDASIVNSWLGRMVDICRIAVHAGRHDISHFIMSPQVIQSHHKLSRDEEDVVSQLQSIQRLAFCFDTLQESPWHNTFCIQASYSILSQYLSMEERNLCCFGYTRECIQLLLYSLEEKEEKKSGETKDPMEHLRSILFQRDTISMDTSRKEENTRNLEEVKSLIVWARDTFRDGANSSSNMVLEDQLLKPCWSLASGMIHNSSIQTRQWQCLKGTIIMGFCIMGCLQRFANIAQEDLLPTANLAATMMSINTTIQKILHDFPKEEELLLAPLYAVSATAATFLRHYSAAQNLLEAALGWRDKTSRTEQQRIKLMPYSELLWSQIVHLRMCLPTDSEASTRTPVKENNSNIDYKEPSPSCHKDMKILCDRIERLKIKLHHMVLHGDSNLVQTTVWHTKRSSWEVKELNQATKNLLLMIFYSKEDENEDSSIELDNYRLTTHHSNYGKITSLSSLPISILLAGQSSQRHMRLLSLKNCQLNSLPTSFGLSLRNLTRLNLSHNSLTALPSSMKWMRSLQELILCHNQIKTLPELGGGDLQVLKVSHNCLVGKLSLFLFSKLQELDLSHNSLEKQDLSFSKLIFNCKKLRNLKFEPQSTPNAD